MVDDTTIELFRQDLPIIRAFAGWSLEDLAEMLDVSRTTATYLESKPGTMKSVHFYAINYLITHEMITNGALSFQTIGKKKGAKQLKEDLAKWLCMVPL